MTHIQFLILELFVSVIEMQIVLRYYTSVYGVAKHRMTMTLLSIPYILAVTGILKYFVFQPHNSASLPVITIIASLVFLPFMTSRWEKKLLFSAVLIGVSYAWTFFSDMITLTNQQWNIWVRYISFHAGFWVLLELLKRVGKREYQYIPKSMWLLLISIASLSTFVCYTIVMGYQYGASGYPRESDFLVMVAFLLINTALFLFYERFSQLLQRVKDQSLLEQQLSLQSEHYKDLQSHQQQIASLHHDMRNTIDAAVYLARSGNTSTELAAYLESAHGKLEDIEQTVATGNHGIDSVLNLKLSQLRYSDIPYRTDIHIPAGLPLSFEDSVTIFGNLLDNVREACEKLPVTSRWAHILLSYSSGSLYIKVDNSVLEHEAGNEGDALPRTTKANLGIHGYGLKNIAQVVEQRGTMRIDRSKPGVFSLRIMLYGL